MAQSKPTTSEVVMLYQLQRLERRQETDQALLNLLNSQTPSAIIDQFVFKRQERMEKRHVEIAELRKRIDHLQLEEYEELPEIE